MSGNLIVIKHGDLQDTKPNFEINIIFYEPTYKILKTDIVDELINKLMLNFKLQEIKDLFSLTFILFSLKLNSGLFK